MGWAKFDDRYSEHPKVVAAGPAAELIDRRAIEYCARYETDGEIGHRQVIRMAADLTADLGVDVEEAIAALLRVGRWSKSEQGYSVHDFLDYHPSRAAKEAEREEARQRMAKSRAKRRGSSPDVRPNTQGNIGGSSPYPVPVPVPLEGQGLSAVADATSAPKARPKRATQIPAGWKPNDTHREIARERGVDVEAEAVQFRDHAQANGRTLKDWDAGFRTWLRKAWPPKGGGKAATREQTWMELNEANRNNAAYWLEGTGREA